MQISFFNLVAPLLYISHLNYELLLEVFSFLRNHLPFCFTIVASSLGTVSITMPSFYCHLIIVSCIIYIIFFLEISVFITREYPEKYGSRLFLSESLNDMLYVINLVIAA